MGAWVSGGNISVARNQLAGAGTLTSGLIFGGQTDTAYKNTTEEYDGTSWTSGGNLNYARSQLAGAGTQTAGLSFGGEYSVAVNYTEEYDGNNWAAGGNMGTARSQLAGAGTQTAGLSFGGYNGVSKKDTTEEYDGTSWAAGGALGTATNFLAGAGTQTAGLEFGGNDSGGRTTTTQEYDGTSWAAGGALPTATCEHSGAGTQTAGLAFGGTTASGTVATTYEYNGTSWTTIGGTMLQARSCPAGLGVQSGAVAAGGYYSSRLSSTEEYGPYVEKYDATSLSESVSVTINGYRLTVNVSDLTSVADVNTVEAFGYPKSIPGIVDQTPLSEDVKVQIDGYPVLINVFDNSSVSESSGISSLAMYIAVYDNGIINESLDNIMSNIGDIAAELPDISGLFSGYSYTQGDFNAELPAIEGQFYGAGDIEAELPMIEGSFSGYSYTQGDIEAELPMTEAEFEGYAGIGMTLGATMPMIEGSFSGYVVNEGEIAAELPGIYANFSGYVFNSGIIDAELPAIEGSFEGDYATQGDIEAELPMIAASFSGYIGELTEFATLVLNTENFALTTYDGFDFNSYAECGGRFFACDGSNVYELTGDLDGTDEIQATMRFPVIDLHDVGVVNRLFEAQVTGRIDGQLNINLIPNEDVAEKYEYQTSTMTGDIQEDRVKFGKGIKDRFICVEVTNEAGCDFDINGLRVFTKAVPKRKR